MSWGNWITQILGFGKETGQWATEWGDAYRSGFSSEDLSSNRAGANFGASWVADGHSLAEDLAYFWVMAGAERPTSEKGKKQVGLLPKTDPAGNGGSSNGSNVSNVSNVSNGASNGSQSSSAGSTSTSSSSKQSQAQSDWEWGQWRKSANGNERLGGLTTFDGK